MGVAPATGLAADVAAASNATAAASVDTMLEFDNVRAAYGDIEVIHGVTLSIQQGSVFALLGPNGAGKSTLLKVCAGLLPVTKEKSGVAGVPIHRPNQAVVPDELARARGLSDTRRQGVFPNLSVKDNLKMMSHTGKSVASIEAVAYSQFPRLKERRSQLAGTLSGGEQADAGYVAGRWRPTRPCCCWMSCRWGWLRSLCKTSTKW